MNYTNSLSLHRIPLKATVTLLATACVLPFLIHLIPPIQGTPVGAILLPMFYIPFIAVVFFGLPVGVIVAALAPMINFLITGNPQWQIVAVLSFELIVFALIAHQLLRRKGMAWLAAPLAYMLTKIVSSVLLIVIPLVGNVEPIQFFMNSVSNAWPGLLALGVINFVVLRYQQRLI
ncbi:MAG: hypothetical protein RIG62_10085 [Cyclobacteriaceae bacterium]